MREQESAPGRHALRLWIKAALESGLLDKLPAECAPGSLRTPREPSPTPVVFWRNCGIRIPAGGHSSRSSPMPGNSGPGSKPGKKTTVASS